MDARPSSDQLRLDFSSRRNELLALVSGLARSPHLDTSGKVMSRGRINGVIELLKRLVVLSQQIPADAQSAAVAAQVVYLAASMAGFRVVSERTLRYWSKDAQDCGLLSVDVRNQICGGREWNEWTIDLRRLRELACNGLQRPAMVAAPGAAMVAAPSIPEVLRECITNRTGPVAPGPVRSDIFDLPDWPELHDSGVAEEQLPAVSDEELLGLPEALQLWFSGKRRGTDGSAKPDCPGLFAPLCESWLADDEAMSFWHRWQLRSSSPVVGATQAHRALVLATARHAVAFPKARLKRNRIGLFVGIVSKRFWEPVRSQLAEVIRL